MARYCIVFLITVVWSGLAFPEEISQSSDNRLPDVTEIDEIAERVEILKLINNAIASNLGKIQTWKGRFRFQDRQFLDLRSAREFVQLAGGDAKKVTGPIRRTDVGTIEFAYDSKSDRVFTTYALDKPIEFQLDKPIEDVANNPPVFVAAHSPRQRSILTPEYYLHLDPTMQHGKLRAAPDIYPVEGPVAFREEIGKARVQKSAMVMDPRMLFDCGIPVVRLLENAINALTEGEKKDGVLTADELEINRRFIQVLRVEPKGSKEVIYRIQVGPLPDRGINQVQTLTVNSEAAFNVVQVTVFDGSRLLSQMDWKFRQHGGIFVPEYFRKMASTKDGRHVSSERILTLQESMVNEPLAESTFSYEHLGLTNGDRLEDVTEKTVYVLRNGLLVAPETIKNDAALKLDATVSSRFVRIAVIIVSIIIIAVLVAIIPFRRKRNLGMP